MKKQRVLFALLRGMALTMLACALLAGDLVWHVNTARAAGAVSLQVSGMTATISNGIFTIQFNSSGTATSLVWNGKEFIGPAKGFYSSINGGTTFSPTSLSVVTNTSDMADIAYSSSWGDLHYVVRSGVSGLYSYFIASSGIGTVGEFRTLYRVDSSIFTTGYNGVQTAIAFPTLSQIQAATKLQDATFQLADGTVYTKYDASTYVDSQDSLHGVYGNGAGVWMISPSHEYVNGGPLKQELTVHVDENNGDAVVLNMLMGSHFGNPNVTIPSGKIYGPWLVYFNNGSITDAQNQVKTEQAAWPYTWLSNSAFPLNRTTVTGTLKLADGRPAAGATVTLAQPGGDVYSQGSDYIFTAQADSTGRFSIPKVRPGSYSLYAWANGGSIGDVTDQFEQDNVTVNGTSVNLGTITWTPTLFSNLLWQIGTADRKADEFKLGSVARQFGLWTQVPANLTYTIGQSTPANDWFYAQTNVGTWTVNFNLSKAQTGDAHLTVALAGSTRTADLTIAVNGTQVGSTPSPDFTNDMTIYRSGNQSGSYHLLTFTFPASTLVVGNNTVTFDATSVSSGGGGAMYDTIKLETGNPVTGGGNPPPTPTPTPTPVPPTPTPTPPAAGTSCGVSYNARSQSNGTFSASIVLTNTGSAALSNWSLTFSFPNGQTISQMFNGNFTQSGSKVTITSGNLNKTIAAGGKTTITFNGTWSGTNNPPTSFKLNGTTCSTS